MPFSLNAEDIANRQIPVRSIHTSTRLLRDKRWVNSTSEKDAKRKQEEDEDEGIKEEKERVKEQEVGTKAESSKAAQQRAKAEQQTDNKSTTITPSSSSSSTASPSSSTENSTSNSTGESKSKPSTGREIAKLNVPDTFPQVLALPITHRPLFPTFYKAVTITHPHVIKAIRELLAHGQPYIGAFLFKDPDSDADVITSMDQVHPVGVFAQITSSFESTDKRGLDKHKEKGDKGNSKKGGLEGKDGKDGEDAKNEEQKSLTVVLYPHRRIRIDELVRASPTGESVPIATVVEEVQKEAMNESDEVSSFEKDVPSVDAVREELGTPPPERGTSIARPPYYQGAFTDLINVEPESEAESEKSSQHSRPLSQINFLHNLLPDVSITNVSNFMLEPYRKDTQMIRALMSELISAFKDLAQLQPIFREQSEHLPDFLISGQVD